MKSGGPGGKPPGPPDFRSEFTDAVLLGTPVILLWWNQVVQEVCRCWLLGTLVILLWWNQVVQEVYRCCFTWDTRHITLMKSGGPGGLQMLFYLGRQSYYSDEIRWSRRFVDAVLLGTPVILLWWNQVVPGVCRCCTSWTTWFIIVIWPGGLQCCFTWDTRHITLMKSGGPGGLQMLFYLGHPSYYSDEIRWSRR